MKTPQDNCATPFCSKHNICTTENGSIKIRDSEITYASNAHWAAVLESIAELRNELSDESNAASVAGGGIQQHDPPCPRLFYGGDPQAIDLDSILECLPPRIVVDRSISRYFNSLDATAGKSNNCRHNTLQGLITFTGILHSGKFLREVMFFLIRLCWVIVKSVTLVWDSDIALISTTSFGGLPLLHNLRG